jgi:hypothetical protein
VAAFCREHGLCEQTFHYWRNRLQMAASSFGPQDILPRQHSFRQSISNGASQSTAQRKPISHCALEARPRRPHESAIRNLNTYGGVTSAKAN